MKISEPIATTEQRRAATDLNYVLVTPARNEADFIELTIKSVVAQSVRPLRWVIVSDGSTDATDDIVRRYAREHDWIELLQMPPRERRHFAGKVFAFNAGFERIKNLEYDIVGNLDADISFDRDYFSFLLRKFEEDPKLGVAGTPFLEGKVTYDYRFTNIEHVSGACQLFRRECFDSIGGYRPIEAGGIDLVAVTTARMKGWRTRTFVEKKCEHLRKTQWGKYSGPRGKFRSGYHDYLMGVHPIWQFFRSIYQLSRPPILIGGTLLFVGYVWAMVTRAEQAVSKELRAFRKREQMDRLRRFFKAPFRSVTTESTPTS